MYGLFRALERKRTIVQHERVQGGEDVEIVRLN